MMYPLFISCPRGLEYLLETELKTLGLQSNQVNPQGVYGDADIETLYKICLWSRIANRVQLILFSGMAADEQSITALCQNFHWQQIFSSDKSFAIEFHGQSRKIRNTMYGAQLVKDGIVDYFRSQDLSRPSVDKKQPDIRLHAYLKHNQLTLSFDLCGYSLHQRGYRMQAGQAPIKENVAAAMLLRANWPALAEKHYALHDPFCGSGTLVIEAAMMAANLAPGLLRQDQSFQYWAGHKDDIWQKVRAAALEAQRPVEIKISGADKDNRLIAIAKKNAENAGIQTLVAFDCQSIEDSQAAAEQGLLISNPPFGERLDEVTALVPLYQKLGNKLSTQFSGWQAAILSMHAMLAKAIGLRSHKQYSIYNGALACKLYCFEINEKNQRQEAGHRPDGPMAMLINRLQKNLKHLQKWAKKNSISAYRLYDADLPEYAFAVDRYNDMIVLQEYKAPASIPQHKTEKRALEMIQAVISATDVPPQNIVVKQRERQRGKNQYEKRDQRQHKMTVQEGNAKLLVNLHDYIDSGLFLDHRLIRLKFSHLKAGSRFLNLFSYTAAASVHAALAGAETSSVDMSKTYTQWAKENFELNKIPLRRHQFIQADCLQWLNQAKGHYDTIFLDPPSFSNSKRMEDNFDIQRDHIELIQRTMALLKKSGILYFSTNLKKFKLSPIIENQYQVKNITSLSIDEDFKRSKNIHHCFMIQCSDRLEKAASS